MFREEGDRRIFQRIRGEYCIMIEMVVIRQNKELKIYVECRLGRLRGGFSRCFQRGFENGFSFRSIKYR